MHPRDKWYAPKQAMRKRKLVTVTLSDEARALLEWLAEERSTSKSEIVEELIVREGRTKKR